MVIAAGSSSESVTNLSDESYVEIRLMIQQSACLLENLTESNFHPPALRITLSQAKAYPPKNPVVNNDNTSSSLNFAMSVSKSFCVTQSVVLITLWRGLTKLNDDERRKSALTG